MFSFSRGCLRFFSNKFNLPENTEALRRAVEWRCKHVGMLELEMILDKWCKTRLGSLKHDEMEEFHEHVLEAETTELYNYFIKNHLFYNSQYGFRK